MMFNRSLHCVTYLTTRKHHRRYIQMHIFYQCVDQPVDCSDALIITLMVVSEQNTIDKSALLTTETIYNTFGVFVSRHLGWIPQQ